MSLDKAIAHGKERRKPYRGAKAVDAACRNHGGCPACERARTRRLKSAAIEAREQIEDLYDGYEFEEPCLSDLEHDAPGRFWDIVVNMGVQNSV
jgi:hypothetical protein